MRAFEGSEEREVRVMVGGDGGDAGLVDAGIGGIRPVGGSEVAVSGDVVEVKAGGV